MGNNVVWYLLALGVGALLLVSMLAHQAERGDSASASSIELHRQEYNADDEVA